MSGQCSWTMWAGVDDGHRFAEGEDTTEVVYEHFGVSRLFPEAYGCKDVLRVVLTEDPEGPYWGWLGNDDAHPAMVYRRKVLFEVCFPYGVHAEVKAPKGRVVRLRAEPAPCT